MTDQPSFGSRVRSEIIAAWGAVSGVAPHVLHHVGPLAGSALVAGTVGRALFAGIGLAVSIPFLLRLRRRFNTWIAPAIALVVFVVAFTISTLLIAPLLTNGQSGESHGPTVHDPGSREQHGHT